MYEYRDQIAIQRRIQSELAKTDLDALIVVQPEAIFYATGFAANFSYLSGAIGLTLAVVPKEGKISLICNQFEQQAAASTCKDIDIISYPVWIYIEDYYDPKEKEKPQQPDLNKSFSMAAEIIRGKYKNPKVGVELEKLSYSKHELLAGIFGKDKLVDSFGVLTNARAIKTPWEIDVLRKAAQMSEIAMNKTARAVVPGMTEADVMSIFKIECQKQSPDVICALQAHTMGKDFAPSIVPRHTKIYDGDIVRLDGGPLYCGYGSDLARTFALGGRTDPAREKIYAILWDAYAKGIKAIAPGVKFSEIFHLLQNEVAAKIPGFKRGHYGHSIGCNRFTEEYPFISTATDNAFQENMVFCIELPYYSSKNHSYNIEDTFLVTKDGIELFTHANETLYIR